MSEEQLYSDVHDKYYFNDFQERKDKINKVLNSSSSTQSGSSLVFDLLEMTMDKGREIFQHPRDYSKPIIKSARYVWNNFPPLSWFGYGVAALNIVPLAILITFLIGTFSLVLLVSGMGILLAEGFFLGIGLLFFVPVAIFLIFSAISTTFFTVSIWSVYKMSVYVLRNIGLLGGDTRYDEQKSQKILQEEEFISE
ncbi:hypothetical protein RclHR1_01970015 [Rhizophagus clarus]|uniref:Uncharacterized protein n=1 Tax=Rhizophagus clarus TaxID=94130 RepID=A0A2Z6QP59_9GLOM|nr:hypothetical protein RclHR1_01970015 [Rhizophagus clarus]GES97720.1 hypothetical protein GLOIN_2v1519021 [Rhizophagus clarus]